MKLKHWSILLLIFLLASCSPTSTEEAEQETRISVPPPVLPDLGEAPELTNEVWLNTPDPLRLADLRGQVVLLEMWTFG